MYTVTLAEVSLVQAYVILIFMFIERTGRIKAFVLADRERSVKYVLSRLCFFHWSCRLLKIFPVVDSFRVLALFPDKLVCFSTYTGCQIRADLLLPDSKGDVTNKSVRGKKLQKNGTVQRNNRCPCAPCVLVTDLKLIGFRICLDLFCLEPAGQQIPLISEIECFFCLTTLCLHTFARALYVNAALFVINF